MDDVTRTASANHSVFVGGYYANGSEVSVAGPFWSFLPVFYMIVAVGSFTANGALLLLFWRSPHLRTPFSVYVINLLCANLLYAVMRSPAEIFNDLNSGWWLSDAYCTFYIYCDWVWELGIRYCHVIITVNRLWAGTVRHNSAETLISYVQRG